ncbi:ATP-dependent nuclease [Thioalkalivibrio sulfidiphilus]|uniref:ATP-dependent nuclease n=1 Tax=Thioalkalivibrio sulfidiphilus TaxID=1033854 RepID=UPI0003773C4C|nr:ATP-binding protein [Thioalkalivibrio sulfidiphilus]
MHIDYIEIEHFKRFATRQRIALDHPAVLIGPNNCGKTSAIQALALWSLAVKTWYDLRKESSAKDRTSAPINRLAITAVPIPRTRLLWHQAKVRTGNKDIPLTITVGVCHNGLCKPITMRFRNQGDELIYCDPDDAAKADMALMAHAAGLKVELLYPMSGLESEEPVLKPGRIDVLLGQGRTAEVLRNLCLMVHRDHPDDWNQIKKLMKRLFHIDLGEPLENARGAVELHYRQQGAKEPFDLSQAGRGLQQMLLVFAYLYAHKGSILMIDEPDAHLEILRQRQIYVLLRDIAQECGSQILMATHSEVILDEALDNHLVLLLEGRADDVARKADIKNSLKHFGAAHYIRARERGYVFYVEGSTDVEILRALAERLNHPVARQWDERLNVFYVQDNFPLATADSELERVEGGFGITPRDHFNALRNLIPGLKGLGILDNDGRNRQDLQDNALTVTYWSRYEAENYFITPDVLRAYAQDHLDPLFRAQADEVLDTLIREQVFANKDGDFQTWKSLPPDAARLLWQAQTQRLKLSHFAEEYFRRLAEVAGGPMLLRKGQLHLLVQYADPAHIDEEVRHKLDLLQKLISDALPDEPADIDGNTA